MGFNNKKRVLRRGSEQGVSGRCLERPLGEYAPLGVRPIGGGVGSGSSWGERNLGFVGN